MSDIVLWNYSVELSFNSRVDLLVFIAEKLIVDVCCEKAAHCNIHIKINNETIGNRMWRLLKCITCP